MTPRSRSMTVAMLSAAVVAAQFVAGKATRDALFLTSLGFAALPTMLIATSLCSLVLVAAQARWGSRIAPRRLVPAAFVLSGLLFLVEWVTRAAAPGATAVLMYLHVSGGGPLLSSGFWLIASERFDPRTAKKGFGHIAAAGTLGGLLGALVAERMAVLPGIPGMLPLLSALQFFAAWLVARLSTPGTSIDRAAAERREAAAMPSSSGLRIVARTPPLRSLAALVLLGTTGAALLDYLFKATAVETLGGGDHLLRFFALYYAMTSLATFALQAASSRTVLERFGLALTTSTPSIALLAGSLGSLAVPGFGGLAVARAGESIFRGSWFRSGYELFYTPMPVAEKRAAKSVIDVAFDRLGDAVGGGLVRLAVVFVPAVQSSAILSMAIATAVGAIVVASTLNRWYLRTLEGSLLQRAGGVDLSDPENNSVRTVLPVRRSPERPTASAVEPETGLVRGRLDSEVRRIEWLRSGHRDRIIQVLSTDDGIAAGLVPHVIPLLAWDPVAHYALFALRRVAEEHVGGLVDALIDPNQDEVVRHRLARVFSVCVSQRAADGVALALDDPSFTVRFQAARSLAAIFDKNPRIKVDRDRIFDVVMREADRGHLDHIFTLLSVVLPREPLRIAYRSLRGDDRHLRGTALEYLEGVLPLPIRQRLWPSLVGRRTARSAFGTGAARAEQRPVAGLAAV